MYNNKKSCKNTRSHVKKALHDRQPLTIRYIKATVIILIY